jgi:hypothetical protein
VIPVVVGLDGLGTDSFSNVVIYWVSLRRPIIWRRRDVHIARSASGKIGSGKASDTRDGGKTGDNGGGGVRGGDSGDGDVRDNRALPAVSGRPGFWVQQGGWWGSIQQWWRIAVSLGERAAG